MVCLLIGTANARGQLLYMERVFNKFSTALTSKTYTVSISACISLKVE